MRYSVLLILIMFIIACAHPAKRVQTLDDRPMLSIKGTSDTATVFVDGLNMGTASIFSGNKNALRLEPGTHLVEIRDGSQTYFKENLYLGSGSNKTIDLGGK